jgi:hypothetical protein
MSNSFTNLIKNYHVKIFLVFLCLNSFCLSDNHQIEKRYSNNALKSNPKNVCPLCGIDSSNSRKEKSLHKIIECEKLNNTLSFSNNNKYMPSYKCKCKYLRVNEKSCSMFSRSYKYAHNRFENLYIGMKASDFMNEDEELFENANDDNNNDENKDNEDEEENGEVRSKKASHLTSECLIVHVGMAIKGYNLMYKQWINKENCFNLCLNTTIRNGFSFDCKSFEHWHSDCGSPSGDPSFGSANRTKSAVCATFVSSQDKRRHYLKNDLEDESDNRAYLKKRASNKIDYCVLSNQTIQMAGKNFAENIAVTYYELLCKSKYNFHFYNMYFISKINPQY